jgi:hypothetical protein
MMKLVVFGAVASAALAPLVRFAQMGAVTWPFTLLMGAVAGPIVLALVALPLVRSGPLKDWLVRLLLLSSISVILAAGVYTLFWASIGPPALNVWANTGTMTAITVGFIRAVIVVLSIPFAVLLGQVVPGWCPDCQAPTLLPDGATADHALRAPRRTPWCLSCQGRFQKAFGAWRGV